MTQKNKILNLIAGASLLAAAANATTVQFDTPAGATTSGGAVSAEAVFTTGANTLTVTLTDLQANPTDVAQLISDISFDFARSVSSSGTSLSSASGSGINVAADGTTTPGTVASDAWALSGFHLTALGGSQPKGLIIGPAGSGGVYTSANGSIAGNGPHNPFYDGSATFTLSIPGLTADDVVSGATFSFGTTADTNLVSGVHHVPDGGTTIMMLGAALSGLGLIRRKK